MGCNSSSEVIPLKDGYIQENKMKFKNFNNYKNSGILLNIIFKRLPQSALTSKLLLRLLWNTSIYAYFGKVKFNINHITYQIIESLKNHFIQ